MSDHLQSRRELFAKASLLAATAAVAYVSDSAKAQATSETIVVDRNAALTRKPTIPTPESSAWPVLTRYDEAHLARLAMPIGGIGTGTISIGGRGNLRDWELVNKPAKGYAPPNTFFALYAKPRDGESICRAIEGPMDFAEFEGSDGSHARNHGLPRFRQCNFAAAYPLGQVLLADPDVPLQVRIEAFNPMIPGDTDISGIPLMALRFVLINPTSTDIDASVCGTLENFIGWDGDSGPVKKNVNEYRGTGAPPVQNKNDQHGRGARATSETFSAELNGLFMHSTGLDPKNPAWGTLALATTSKDVTYRTAWSDIAWGDTLLDFWDDFSTDGKLENRDGKREAPFGSLAASTTIPANGSSAITFLIAWHFPNRLGWTAPPERIGNFYTTQYADAWDVLTKTAPKLVDLEAKTVQFVKTFVDSDIPAVIKEAALYNASTVRTQTCFRDQTGRFFGWEGCNDHAGWCEGNCMHVWNYEHATAFLYGPLARSMRDTDFAYATTDAGAMCFRCQLPLDRAQQWGKAAADGQMGTIMRLYRDWRMSGDDAMLQKLWPHAKKAMEFAWIPNGWDADKDGVMEGCQHNTMDVEYYGPNPEMGTYYLGALRASEEMAKHAGDTDFASTCRKLFDSGSQWLDANLFNGEYYIHQIIPPKDPQAIPKEIRLGGLPGPDGPAWQLGAACLCDQMVGQNIAHLCGLGYLLKKENVSTALASVMKYNWCDNFFGHFNHLRSYALGDDQGLLVATWPKGNRPTHPFPYCNEVWTGLEYTAASGMLYEGQTDNAIKVISAVRARHDGLRRSPFNEPECGHHYARAMASWSTLVAYTGFQHDGVEQRMTFRATDKPATWFWSNGDAWGTMQQTPAADGADVVIRTLGGTVKLASVAMTGIGVAKLDKVTNASDGNEVHVHVARA